MNLREIKPGDRLVWLYTPRGGYGYSYAVDARVVKVGAKKVQIEVPHVHLGPVLRWVSPERLRPRSGSSSTDEQLQVNVTPKRRI